MSGDLLQTKLYVPRLRPSLVPRPHLIEKLNQGLHRKLTLISAPAGFGKTTLITAWLSQLDQPVGWVSLDEDDSDPQQFFRYVAAAIRPFPNSQQNLTNQLQSQQPLPAKALAAALVNDLAAISTPCLLILDDYHEIDSAEIDLALAFLLDHMPPNLHLVITSRADPGFPLSRLRARGQLTEVRIQDLRFTVEETAVFLQTVMGIPLTPEQIASLETCTEGWIAGLQMAALSMQNRADVAGFVAGFTGSHRFIMDYLMEEVLNQQSTEVQDFLLQTAVLSRLCADLCDTVRQSPPISQQILEQLETNNIFLIPLDNERRWYRYHHLFADLLRQKLPAAAAQSACQKAAKWSAENGLTADAIDYALAAEDWETAVPLLVEHGLRFVFQGKLNRLRRWFDALPRDLLLQQPRMCLDYAWVLVNQGEKGAVEPYLWAAETAADDAPTIRTVTAIIRANNARAYENLSVMQAEAALSLQLAAPDNDLARCTALLQLGVAQILAEEGDLETAVTTLQETSLLARQSRNINTALLAGGYLGLAHLLREDVAAATAVLQETPTFAANQGLQESSLLAYVHLGLAHLAFLDEDWDGARDEIEQAQAHGRFAEEISALFRGDLLLALVEQTAGNRVAVEMALHEVVETAVVLKNSDIPQQIQFFQDVLQRSNPPSAMIETARLVAAGASLSCAQTIAQPTSSQPDQPLIDPLSDRELEVLGLIAAGLKNQEIADQLVISLNTVLYHNKNIYSKLGVNKRTLAITKARELNLIE